MIPLSPNRPLNIKLYKNLGIIIYWPNENLCQSCASISTFLPFLEYKIIIEIISRVYYN